MLKRSTKVNAIPAPAPPRPTDSWEVPVLAIHCHFCGGVVRDRATIDYRPPRSSAQVALPQTGTCTCTPPIVYEDSPLDHPAAHEARVARVKRVEPIKPVEQVKRVERLERDAAARPPAPPYPADPWKGAV